MNGRDKFSSVLSHRVSWSFFLYLHSFHLFSWCPHFLHSSFPFLLSLSGGSSFFHPFLPVCLSLLLLSLLSPSQGFLVLLLPFPFLSPFLLMPPLYFSFPFWFHLDISPLLFPLLRPPLLLAPHHCLHPLLRLHHHYPPHHPLPPHPLRLLYLLPLFSFPLALALLLLVDLWRRMSSVPLPCSPWRSR